MVCQAFCHYAQSAERIASYPFGSCIELLASLLALACRSHISHQHVFIALIFGYIHTRSAPSAMRSATLLLTFVNLWSNFQCSLGDRLAVGRMTLDHATGVRILLPQPLGSFSCYSLFVIRYWKKHQPAVSSLVRHNPYSLDLDTNNQ